MGTYLGRIDLRHKTELGIVPNFTTLRYLRELRVGAPPFNQYWKSGAVDGTRTRDPRRDRPIL
jgi:hypothetical protein